MWRLRTIIQSETTILIGETENSNAFFKVFAIDENNTENGEQIPDTNRYCDIILKGSVGDIYNAFVLSLDEVNRFLDRISMVSYGTSFIAQINSICPDVVVPGDEFDLALPQYITNRKTLPIQLDGLNMIEDLTPEQQRWVRLLRNGLNSNSEEEKYINYYSLLEEIARQECTEFIITKCSNQACLKEVNTGRKATNNFIKNILKEHSVEPVFITKSLTLRNKIAHGGANKNKAYLEDLRIIGSHLEEICLIELESRLPLNIVNRLNAHIVKVPIVTHRCLCNIDGSFDLINTNQRIPARFVKLKSTSNSCYEGQSTRIGMPLDSNDHPIINPFAWPNIGQE